MRITKPQTIALASITSNVPLEPQWSAATNYAKNAVVRGNTGLTEFSLYVSMVDNNQNQPLTDTAKWVRIGAANRYKMFDAALNTQTLQPTAIEVEFPLTERADRLYLMNVAAAKIHVVLTDPIEGVVMDQEIGLISQSGVTDWYEYFFAPIETVSDIEIALPPYAGATLKVTIENELGSVQVGEVVVGLSREVGGTEYGMRLGFISFSRKDRDQFGVVTILKRSSALRGSFPVYIPAGAVDSTMKFIREIEAIPVVFVGADGYASSMIYGIVKDFDLAVEYRRYSRYTLETEGLI